MPPIGALNWCWLAPGKFPVYSEAPKMDGDVLYPDSDDDDYSNPTDRRLRIEAQGQRFLQGKPIFLLSASLRGPFTQKSDWVNPWASHTSRPGTNLPEIADEYDSIGPSTGFWDTPVTGVPGNSEDKRRNFSHIASNKIAPERQSARPSSCPAPALAADNCAKIPPAAGTYIDSESATRVETWREEVEPAVLLSEDFWTPNRSSLKRHPAAATWLRKQNESNGTKRRRLLDTDNSPIKSPTPATREFPGRSIASSPTATLPWASQTSHSSKCSPALGAPSTPHTSKTREVAGNLPEISTNTVAVPFITSSASNGANLKTDRDDQFDVSQEQHTTCPRLPHHLDEPVNNDIGLLDSILPNMSGRQGTGTEIHEQTIPRRRNTEQVGDEAVGKVAYINLEAELNPEPNLEPAASFKNQADESFNYRSKTSSCKAVSQADIKRLRISANADTYEVDARPSKALSCAPSRSSVDEWKPSTDPISDSSICCTMSSSCKSNVDVQRQLRTTVKDTRGETRKASGLYVEGSSPVASPSLITSQFATSKLTGDSIQMALDRVERPRDLSYQKLNIPGDVSLYGASWGPLEADLASSKSFSPANIHPDDFGNSKAHAKELHTGPLSCPGAGQLPGDQSQRRSRALRPHTSSEVSEPSGHPYSGLPMMDGTAASLAHHSSPVRGTESDSLDAGQSRQGPGVVLAGTSKCTKFASPRLAPDQQSPWAKIEMAQYISVVQCPAHTHDGEEQSPDGLDSTEATESLLPARVETEEVAWAAGIQTPFSCGAFGPITTEGRNVWDQSPRNDVDGLSSPGGPNTLRLNQVPVQICRTRELHHMQKKFESFMAGRPYTTSKQNNSQLSVIAGQALATFEAVTDEELRPASQPVLQVSKPFNPLSSPISESGVMEYDNSALPEHPRCPGTELGQGTPHSQHFLPSTPETKQSSLPTPDVSASMKSFNPIESPSPRRCVSIPLCISTRDDRLPSTQILVDASLSNPWIRTSSPGQGHSAPILKRQKQRKQVSWAALPGEEGHGDNGTPDYSISETLGTPGHQRVGSPPPSLTSNQLPRSGQRFCKHFATITGRSSSISHRRTRSPRKLLPSASQRSCPSPAVDAMAEAFMQADTDADDSKYGETAGEDSRGGWSPSIQRDRGPRQEGGALGSFLIDPNQDEGADDVSAVLDNLGDFLDYADTDAELSKMASIRGKENLIPTTIGTSSLDALMDSDVWN